MFGRSHDSSSELEVRLRAERPQPPDELVSRLAAQFAPAARPVRQRGVPRIALIAAATAVLALSLGAAGAIGSATGSIHLFGTSVLHLVKPPPARATTNAPSTNLQTVTPGHLQTGGLDPRTFSYRHFPPFMHQYAGKIPICWHGHIIYIYPFQWFWYFIHGAGPARSCFYPHR
jgi:hypothetical protein